MVAAGLGLGALAALATLLWITSPYPDSGADGALHVAADLWLLAHGVQLVRNETLSGAPAPLGMTPLLLSVLPVWLLYRAAQHAFDEADLRVDDRGRAAVAGWVCGGYLLVGGLSVIYAARGRAIGVDVLSAAFQLPFTAACVTGVAVWTACERPVPVGGAWLWRVLTRARVLAVLRSSGLALAVLLVGGSLLFGAGLLWHGDAVTSAFPQLTADWPGRFALLLLAFALAPNAVVWAASYGLGPGFTIGGGSVVSPLGAHGYPQLPDFPLLAAVPGEGPGGPVLWGVAGVWPVATGAACGWCVARAAVPVRGERAGTAGPRGTALTAGLAAGACGAATAFLAASAGGAMGTGTLAWFGPSWWLTGLAAFAWTALVGVPAALTVRAWRLRERRVREEPVTEPAPEPDGTAEEAESRRERRRRKRAERRAAKGGTGAGASVPGQAGAPDGGSATGAEPEGKRSRRSERAERKSAAKLAKAERKGAKQREKAERKRRDRAPVHVDLALPAESDGATGTGDGPGPDWHSTGARRTRWAALKESSGDLMGDVEPPDRPGGR
nr:DUF6350 family protein [Streptomyces sp. HNM0574]